MATRSYYVYSSLFYLSCIASLITVYGYRRRFKPLWHQPNDFDLHGELCENRRPSLDVDCPPFGVNLKDMTITTADAIDEKCAEFGFPSCRSSNMTLLPSGECGKKGTSPTQPNPFSCTNSKRAQYMPCNQTTKSRIPHFYHGFNLQEQQTMEACALSKNGTREKHTKVDIFPLGSHTTRTFPFPLISDSSKPQDFGFLQCPTDPEPEYSFASVLWIVIYSFFGFCWVLIFIFGLFKIAHEKRTRRMGEAIDLPAEGLSDSRRLWDDHEGIELQMTSLNHNKGKSDRIKGGLLKGLLTDRTGSTMDFSFMESDKLNMQAGIELVGIDYSTSKGVKQIGYRNSLFGVIAYVILWIASIGWLILLLLIILDFYGMHVWTLCDKEARTACRKAQREDPLQFLSFRTGYSCASGCLFSWRWTTGVSTTWPYYRNNGGGHQLDAIFIVVWHLTVAWFIMLKALQSRIRSFFRIRCELDVATTVLITRPKEKEIFVESEENSFVVKAAKMLDGFRDRYLGGDTVTVDCEVKQDQDRRLYIDFQCLRYCWSDSNRRFVRAKVNVGNSLGDIKRSGGGLTATEARRRMDVVGANSLDIDFPSMSRSIFLEFFDWFYLYQFFCLWVWCAFFYWSVACVIFAAVIISGLVKVHTRFQSQMQVRNLAHMYSKVNVFRDGIWNVLDSSHLVPGDVIHITRGDVPCDCVLLEGTCVVNESSLTGEPTPVPKIPVGLRSENTEEDTSADTQRMADGTRKYSPSGDTLKYTLLAGTSVEAATGGSRGLVIAVVMATGAHTEKGKLIREMMFPPPLSFKFDQHWKLIFLVLLVWGFIVLMLIFRMVRWSLVGWYYGLSTISQIMSPLIPAVFVASRANSARRLLRNHKIRCVNFDRILVCGKVKNFCFDKTGTLTKSGLSFYGIVPIDNGKFGASISLDRYGNLVQGSDLIILAIACTHELLLGQMPEGYDGPATSRSAEIVGNEVDRRMFAASGFELLVDGSDIRVKSDCIHIRILRRFEFDRSTMTMSCIVEDVNDSDARFVFVKGTFEAVSVRSNFSAVPENFMQRARDLAREGFYTVAVAYRAYSGPKDIDRAVRSDVEADLNPLGIIVFTNDLKPEASGVIRELKEGSIRPVMITGDAALTAIKIARLCGLSTSPRLIIGDSNFDPESTIDWRDVDSGDPMDPWKDCWRDLETGNLEIALTGAAFEKLSKIPLASFDNGDPFSDIQMASNRDDDDLIFNSQLKPLLRYTRIFARMKPDQKVQVIKLHMLTGATAMAGDGANDVGAIRIAHVGIALGNESNLNVEINSSSFTRRDHRVESSLPRASDASVTAPFSTSSSSLKAVSQLVKEGRCALATSLAGYKYLMVYGEVMVAISFVMYYYGVNLSEAYWITIDSLVNLGMVWAIMQAKPNSVLTPIRPSSKLLGSEVFASVLIQLLINIVCLAICIAMLFTQEFFVCREFDANLVEQGQWWKKADNYEASVIALLSYFQLVNSAAVFNFGFDYRQSWKKNAWIIILWIFWILFGTFLLFAPPSYITCLYRINCGDISLLQWWTKLGKISLLGNPSSAPIGCPCNAQVGFDTSQADSWLCESEYIDCKQDHYTQTYHHNILPYYFRGLFFMVICINLALGFICEWLFIVGPVRRKLRNRRLKLRTQAKLLSGGESLNSNALFGTSWIDGTPISSRLRAPSLIIGSIEPATASPRHMDGRPSLQGVGYGGVGVSGTGPEWEGEISTSSRRNGGGLKSPGYRHSGPSLGNGTLPSTVGKPLGTEK